MTAVRRHWRRGWSWRNWLLAGAVDVECDGGAGAADAAGGNNLGLSGSTDGASSCAQNGPASPACATSDGGSGNGGTGDSRWHRR